jgi:hypothetical protein
MLKVAVSPTFAVVFVGWRLMLGAGGGVRRVKLASCVPPELVPVTV